jgi:hypothetical protein
MLFFGDRVKVKDRHHRLAGWKGSIKTCNAARYGIRFDKTPSVTVFLNHDAVEKI